MIQIRHNIVLEMTTKSHSVRKEAEMRFSACDGRVSGSVPEVSSQLT